MREIVLDTETTGLDPTDGHRLVEIGCIELHNFVPTGRTFHHYLNPERDVPPDATAVHGLTTEFLAKQPVLAEIIDGLLEFLADTPLVIHNATFDLKFINAELKGLGFKPLANPVTDTVKMAREKYPGQPANLDALCKRFKIDLSERTLHGALLDAQLLADVYLEMRGGRQQGLALLEDGGDLVGEGTGGAIRAARMARPARNFAIPDKDTNAHDQMIAALGEHAVWKKYRG